MASNLGQAARVTVEISNNVATVAQVAQDAAAGADQSRVGAGEVAREAEELRTLIGRFHLKVVDGGSPSREAHSTSDATNEKSAHAA
jgi:hypothetical protein